MDIRDRVCLVTGGGRRVGRAIALALGQRGARVALHYHRSDADARTTVSELEALGTDARAFAADLGAPDAPAALVRDVHASFGAFDVLINSAAVMHRTPLGDVTTAAWDAMFAVNLRAPFFCAQAASIAMGERGGAIVNIADLAAFESWPAYIPHGISKAGIVQMTRALARALAPRVRVNAVAPGAVLLPDDWDAASARRLAETTPMGRLGSPTDVSSAVLFLLEAEFITGETIIVDGGRHVRC